MMRDLSLADGALGAASPWRTFLHYAAFACVVFGVKLWLIGAYGNATPFWDQWEAEGWHLYKPYLEGTLGWHHLSFAHNEHRIFTTRVLALAVLAANGIWNPLLQMVVNAGLHVLVLALLIGLAARAVGTRHLPVLLLFSAVLFAVPYAWENTLVGFNVQYYFVLLFGGASIWLTVTGRPLGPAWWAGLACAGLAFFSLASGILALAASFVVGLVMYLRGARRGAAQLAALAVLLGLFVGGYLATPVLDYHAHLKAASLGQFRDAMIAALGWPASGQLHFALMLQAPALVFAGYMLVKRPAAEDRRWYLLALVGWSIVQAASVAYGRAVGTLTSRYLDLFAFGLMVNFACLLALASTGRGRGWRGRLVAGVWLVVVLASLGTRLVGEIPWQLADKRRTTTVQETNTRNYLRSGDMAHLKDKGFFDIPHPDAERFAFVLQDPTMRSILPANLRFPMKRIEGESVAGLLPQAYAPGTPPGSDAALGSYGPGGGADTGQATLRFEAGEREHELALPLAGYPRRSGMMVEVEQDGRRIPLRVADDPKTAWGRAYAPIEPGELTLRVEDANPSHWLAADAPLGIGRFDRWTDALLRAAPYVILAGLLLAILAALDAGRAGSPAPRLAIRRRPIFDAETLS